MKKIFLVMITVFFLTACGMKETPTKAVEDYLRKYQDVDSSINENMEKILKMDELDEEQEKTYKSLLQKQYQNLSYKIIDEKKDGDNAEVEVEIEVLDYNNTNNKSMEYFKEHKDEFTDKDIDLEDLKNVKEFINYKLDELLKAQEKIKYTLTFNLTKENNEWKIEEISEDDLLKLHGLY